MKAVRTSGSAGHELSYADVLTARSFREHMPYGERLLGI